MVMIRPRPGDFIYGEAEVATMEQDIAHAARLGASGVVFGAVTPEGSVDEVVTGKLVRAARSLVGGGGWWWAARSLVGGGGWSQEEGEEA